MALPVLHSACKTSLQVRAASSRMCRLVDLDLSHSSETGVGVLCSEWGFRTLYRTSLPGLWDGYRTGRDVFHRVLENFQPEQRFQGGFLAGQTRDFRRAEYLKELRKSSDVPRTVLSVLPCVPPVPRSSLLLRVGYPRRQPAILLVGG